MKQRQAETHKKQNEYTDRTVQKPDEISVSHGDEHEDGSVFWDVGAVAVSEELTASFNKLV